MDLARPDAEIDPAQDLVPLHAHVQVGDLKQCGGGGHGQKSTTLVSF
jgi:hypothetical protein